MADWNATEWGLFFAALGGQIVLIIHALASWLGRKESREQNRQILHQVAEAKEQVAEVQGAVSKLGTGTGNGGPV